MRLFDNKGLILKITEELDSLSNREKGYLLKGVMDIEGDKIQIVECMGLDEYTEKSTESRLVIKKEFLYASLKEFIKNNWIYIMVHTHPYQDKSTLKFSCIDDAFLESMNKISTSLSNTLPLIGGIVCKDSVKFKSYYSGEIIEFENIYTKLDEYDLDMWDVEVIRSNEQKKSALYHKKTNSTVILNLEDTKIINEWIEGFKSDKLTILESIAFKEFVYSKFDFKIKRALLSNKNFLESKTINDVRFMIQLGCNLKCKYCYAGEGTYGHSKNVVLNEENAIKIFESFVQKGVKQINNITYFGGEPSEYPKTIRAISDKCEKLVNEGLFLKMPKFFMVTNGTNMSEYLVETIKKYNIKLTISLDGPKCINDQLRIDKNGNGTYKKVHNNILKLRENGIEPAMIEATYTSIHEENNISRGKLSEIIREKESVPIIYMADCSGSEYSPKTKEKSDTGVFERIDKAFLLEGEKDDLDHEVWNYISKIANQLSNKIITNNLHCEAGYNMITVVGNGDYYPCHRFVEERQYKIGNIIKDDQLKILKSILRKDNIAECKSCWASEFCNGCTWKLLFNEEEQLAGCYKKLEVMKYIILKLINLNQVEKDKLNAKILSIAQ